MSLTSGMMVLRRNVLVGTVILLASVLASTGNAGILKTFQIVSGEGTIDQLPDPVNQEQDHVITSGMAMLDGNPLSYTGNGRVRLLGPSVPPPPFTGIAPFESADPFLFDFGGGDTLEMHYGREDFGAPGPGLVILEFLAPDLVDTTWLAVFNPVSGTGQFADVIGGAIVMTAETDPFDPTSMDIPYTWSSDVGFLTFVPEPSSLTVLGMSVSALILVGSRRRIG